MTFSWHHYGEGILGLGISPGKSRGNPFQVLGERPNFAA